MPTFLLFVERTAAVCRRDSRLQEFRDALVGVNLVLDPGEAVALVLVHFVFGHAAALLSLMVPLSCQIVVAALRKD